VIARAVICGNRARRAVRLCASAALALGDHHLIRPIVALSDLACRKDHHFSDDLHRTYSGFGTLRRRPNVGFQSLAAMRRASGDANDPFRS
jgi:hypothetical protein